MGQPNDRLDFIRLENRVSVVAMYQDRNDNEWRISAVGERELIDEFVDLRDLDINLDPIRDEEEIEAFAPLELPENFEALKEQSPALAYQVDEEIGLPGIAVRFELFRPIFRRGPRRITFRLDPAIEAKGKRNYYFNLPAGDVIANVGYTSDVSLSVQLFGPVCATSEGTSGTASCYWFGENTWTVYVKNKDPNAGYFTLNGDYVLG